MNCDNLLFPAAQKRRQCKKKEVNIQANEEQMCDDDKEKRTQTTHFSFLKFTHRSTSPSFSYLTLKIKKKNKTDYNEFNCHTRPLMTSLRMYLKLLERKNYILQM